MKHSAKQLTTHKHCQCKSKLLLKMSETHVAQHVQASCHTAQHLLETCANIGRPYATSCSIVQTLCSLVTFLLPSFQPKHHCSAGLAVNSKSRLEIFSHNNRMSATPKRMSASGPSGWHLADTWLTLTFTHFHSIFTLAELGFTPLSLWLTLKKSESRVKVRESQCQPPRG